MMLAPRAFACSSVSIVIIAPASPNTKPSRSLSNGRHAPAGSSLLVDNRSCWANAAMGIASILVSTPPQIAMSASPSTMLRHASAIASAPEAQAETGVNTPAPAPRSSPTAAAAALGMAFCTPNGEIARVPLSRMSSLTQTNSSVEPITVPMDTISQLVSTSGEAAAGHGRVLLQEQKSKQLAPRQLLVEILQQMPADAHRHRVLVDKFIVEPTNPTLAVQQPFPGTQNIRG